MKQKKTTRVDAFTWINVFILTFLSLMCLLPIINVLAISFSARGPVEAGRVVFWPVDFTTVAYEYVLKDSGFLDAADGQHVAGACRSCSESAPVYSLRLSPVKDRSTLSGEKAVCMDISLCYAV